MCVNCLTKCFTGLSYTTIVAYTLKSQGEEVFTLFSEMQHEDIEPDDFTFSSVIGASAKQAHAHGMTMSNAFIIIYITYASTEDAYQVLSETLVKDRVSWNAIIVGEIP